MKMTVENQGPEGSEPFKNASGVGGRRRRGGRGEGGGDSQDNFGLAYCLGGGGAILRTTFDSSPELALA